MNLKIMEKEDLPLFAEWFNNPDFNGELFAPVQVSRTELEKAYSEPSPFEGKRFIIEKKDGVKVGWIAHFNMLHPMGKFMEIGYAVAPDERGKGYCTEAAKIMVDYLFLSKGIACIQAIIDVRNTASQKVIENAGFRKEGTIRKRFSIRGEWVDGHIYSILREEWKEPKILTRKLS